MYEKILVPVDGSEPSMLGLREAIRLASRHGGRLHFLHVVDELPALIPPEANAGSDLLFEQLRGAGQAVLATAEAEARDAGVSAAATWSRSAAGRRACAFWRKPIAGRRPDRVRHARPARAGPLCYGERRRIRSATQLVPVLLVPAHLQQRARRTWTRPPETSARTGRLPFRRTAWKRAHGLPRRALQATARAAAMLTRNPLRGIGARNAWLLRPFMWPSRSGILRRPAGSTVRCSAAPRGAAPRTGSISTCTDISSSVTSIPRLDRTAVSLPTSTRSTAMACRCRTAAWRSSRPAAILADRSRQRPVEWVIAPCAF